MKWLKRIADWIRGGSRGGIVPLDKRIMVLGRKGHLARCHYCPRLIEIWDVSPEPDGAVYVCAKCCKERNI